MDQRKAEALIHWINVLEIGPPIRRLGELSDGRLLLKLQCKVQNGDYEDAALPQDRFSILQEYLEVIYQINNFSRRVNLEQIIHNHDEEEIAKVGVLLLCVPVINQQENANNFVQPLFMLDSCVQEEVKILIESISNGYEPGKPLDWDVSVLQQRRADDGVQPRALVEAFDSPEVFSNSPQATGRKSTSSLKEYMSPILAGSNSNSPILFNSLSISSPQVVKKIMAKEMEAKRSLGKVQRIVRQKELEIRRMTVELNKEKNLREDLELEVSVKCTDMENKDQRIKQLEHQTRVINQLQQENEFLQYAIEDKGNLQDEIARLKSKLEEYHSIEDSGKALEEENKQLVKEIHELNEQLEALSGFKAEYFLMKKECADAHQRIVGLEASLRQREQDVESLAAAGNAAETRLSQMQEAMKQQKDHYEELLFQAAESSDNGESMGVVTDKLVGELEADLAQVRAELEQSVKSQTELTERLRLEVEKLEQAQLMIITLEQEKDQLKQDRDQTIRKLTEDQASQIASERRGFEEKLTLLREELEGQVTCKEADISTLQDRLQESESHCKSLVEEHDLKYKSLVAEHEMKCKSLVDELDMKCKSLMEEHELTCKSLVKEHDMNVKSLVEEHKMKCKALQDEVETKSKLYDEKCEMKCKMVSEECEMKLKSQEQRLGQEFDVQCLAFEEEHTAQRNALVMEHEKKYMALVEECEMKCKSLVQEHDMKCESLVQENDMKCKSLVEEQDMKCKSLREEHELTYKSLVEEHDMKCKSLREEHELTCKSLVEEHDMKCKSLREEHELTCKSLVQEHDMKCTSLVQEHDMKCTSLVQEHDMKCTSLVQEHDMKCKALQDEVEAKSKLYDENCEMKCKTVSEECEMKLKTLEQRLSQEFDGRCLAFVEEHTAQRDTLVMQHEKKYMALVEECEMKCKSLMEEHDTKCKSLVEEHDMKCKSLVEEHDMKCKSLREEHELTCKSLVQEHDMKCTSLVQEHDMKCTSLVQEHDMKCKALQEEVETKCKLYDENCEMKCKTVSEECEMKLKTLEQRLGQEFDVRCLAFEEEHTAQQNALVMEHEKKYMALVEEWEMKCSNLTEEYSAKCRAIEEQKEAMESEIAKLAELLEREKKVCQHDNMEKGSTGSQFSVLQKGIQMLLREQEELLAKHETLSSQLQETIQGKEDALSKSEACMQQLAALKHATEGKEFDIVERYEKELSCLRTKHESELERKEEEHTLHVQEISQQHAELQIVQASEHKAATKDFEEKLLCLRTESEEKLSAVILEKDQMIEDLSQNVNESEEKLRTAMQNFEAKSADMQARLSSVEEKNAETLESVQSSYQSKIKEMNVLYDGKIKELLSQLEMKKQELQAKEQAFQEDIAAREQSYRSSLSSQEDKRASILASKEEDFQTRLTAQQQEYEANMAAVDQNLKDTLKELEEMRVRESQREESHNLCVQQMDREFEAKKASIMEEYQQKYDALKLACEGKDDLEMKLIEKEKCIEHIKSQLQEERSQLKGIVNQLEEKTKDLEQAYSSMEESYQHEAAKMQKDLEMVYNSNSELQDIHDSITEELKEKNQELNSMRRMKEDADNQVSELRTKIAQQKHKYEHEMGERAEGFHQKLDGFVAQWEQKISDVRREKEELERRLQASSEEHEERLKQAAVEQEVERVMCESKLKASAQQLAALQDELAREKQMFKECRQRLAEELQKLTNDHILLKQEIQEKDDARCSELEIEMKQLKEAFTHERQGLELMAREERQQHEQQLNDLKQAQIEKEKQFEETVLAQSQKENKLEEQLKRSEEQLKLTVEQVEELRSRGDARESQLQASTHELETVREHRYIYRKKLETIEGQFAPLQKKLLDCEHSVKKLSQEKRSLEAQLSHAERQVKQYKTEAEKAGNALPSSRTQAKPSTSSEDSIMDDSLEVRHSSPHPNRPKPMTPYFLRNRHSSTGEVRPALMDSVSAPALHMNKMRSLENMIMPSSVSTPQNKSKSSVVLSGLPLSMEPLTKADNQSVQSLPSLNTSVMSTVSTESTRSANVPRGAGNLFSCEDEEEAGIEYEWNRLGELQRRNTLCLPHLRTCYPVETQTGEPDENIIRGRPSDVASSQSNTSNRKRRTEGQEDLGNRKAARSGTTHLKQGSGPKSRLRRLSADKACTPRQSPRRSARRRSQSAGTPSFSQNEIENQPPLAVQDPRRESIAFSIENTPKAIRRGLKRQTGFVRNNQVERNTQIERKPLRSRNFLQTGL